MSVNCSSSNGSMPSASSTDITSAMCFHQFYQTTSKYSVFTFIFTSVAFLLPVYIFILHLGFKQWRRQSFSTMAMSHFDLFTYNMVLFEVLGIFAFCSMNISNKHLIVMGLILSTVSQSGQFCLHILTCAERHLAVVHPITYLSLKGERWIRVRNVIIGFIWLFSILLAMTLYTMMGNINVFLFICIPVGWTLLLVLVFCLSVLRVLMCSGPGEGTGGKHRIDQSKLRAFYVIVSVLVVLTVRMSWSMISGLVMPHVGQSVKCYLLTLGLWTGLPSSLLMPLLYLQRKGKLVCCKKKK